MKSTLERSTRQVDAPSAWVARFDGKGTKVAVLDTGADAEHPDLKGRIGAARNFTDSADPGDAQGHDTHTVSTVGAVDRDDTTAPFSSRGPSVVNHHFKPEIAAPGDVRETGGGRLDVKAALNPRVTGAPAVPGPRPRLHAPRGRSEDPPREERPEDRPLRLRLRGLHPGSDQVGQAVLLVRRGQDLGRVEVGDGGRQLAGHRRPRRRKRQTGHPESRTDGRPRQLGHPAGGERVRRALAVTHEPSRGRRAPFPWGRGCSADHFSRPAPFPNRLSGGQ